MIKEIIKAIQGCISKIEIAEEARPSENFTRAKNNLDRAIEYLEAEKPTGTTTAETQDTVEEDAAEETLSQPTQDAVQEGIKPTPPAAEKKAAKEDPKTIRRKNPTK